jgi:hypothetical protein
MTIKYCTCGGYQGEVPEYHSCAYVRARNLLIDDAEAQAKAISRTANGKLDFLKYNYNFSKIMHKAAIEAKVYDL